MFCHFISLVLCPIVLSLPRVFLCFVLLKSDWMERKLYSVLNCSVLWKSMGSMNNKRRRFIRYTIRYVY